MDESRVEACLALRDAITTFSCSDPVASLSIVVYGKIAPVA